ncbi:MAG: hypothetical protein CMO44_13580 [Verrucomicrobiales bacterium]|nr:hypothetical protein [Verrucomicrobiales bacterium]
MHDNEHRKDCVNAILTMESFIALSFTPGSHYPELMPDFHVAFDTLKQAKGIKLELDGKPTDIGTWFAKPIMKYFDPLVWVAYQEVVKEPMDLQTLTMLVCDGTLRSIEELKRAFIKISSNCVSFYSSRPEGRSYIQAAKFIEASVVHGVNGGRGMIALNHLIAKADAKYDGSIKYNQKVAGDVNYKLVKSPMKHLLETLSSQVFYFKQTRKQTTTMEPFMNLDDCTQRVGYTELIEEPISLKEVHNKVNRQSYKTPEDFEDDIMKIFENCIVYAQSPYGMANSDGGQYMEHGKNGIKAFKKYYGPWSKRVSRFSSAKGKQS